MPMGTSMAANMAANMAAANMATKAEPVDDNGNVTGVTVAAPRAPLPLVTQSPFPQTTGLPISHP